MFPVEAVVEFDYEAQQEDELSLRVGDIIVKVTKDDGGWWKGEIDGRRGLFPDNFVRVSNNDNTLKSMLLFPYCVSRALYIQVFRICSTF